MGTGSVPRGARSSDTNELSSPSRAQVGSLTGRCLAGRAARRKRLLCVGSRGYNVSKHTAGSSGASGDREGNALGSRLHSVSAEIAAAAVALTLRSGLRPSEASVHGLHGRGSRLLREGAAAARPQPTCPLASRAGVKPRHDKLPGGNDEGPPATQNISPQPSGARRALHEPPARSRPRGPAPGADGRRVRRVRVRAPARGPSRGVCLSVRQVPGARSLAFPPHWPSRDRGARGARARHGGCGGGGGGVSFSRGRSVSQSVSQSGASSGSAARKGLRADAAAAGRSAHQLNANC
ncbi:PREDICTED: uncharacterized protein LOC109395249 [Hipposideros armiger]|uniref:Uncharacterized protein LOC109395249 n=1 Tax=Hipposideros armiger TaxID=186990 RepID=A0A8B7T7I7_HIPAR|nr:PREDICTED: uncharacterized protein LOC109395249 [Hipposideros armiger]